MEAVEFVVVEGRFSLKGNIVGVVHRHCHTMIYFGARIELGGSIEPFCVDGS